MKRIFLGRLFTLLIMVTFISAMPKYGQVSRFKQQFLERINRARQQGCNCGNTFMPPVSPLVWNSQLEDAARGHALDMSERGYFSHTSKNGRTVTNRVVEMGYTYKGFKNFAVGENIAQGQMTIDEVMNGWLRSEGHCRNLMNPAFKEVGVSEIAQYWVQDFGGREPFSAKEQELIKSGRVKLIQRQFTDGH